MLEILLAALVIAADQISKYLICDMLSTLPGKSYPIIEGVFNLTYVENNGAAFGMLQNARVFFIIITVAVCAILIYFWYKERARMKPLMRIALALVFSGALGNLIDRIAIGYVRDMFDLEIINFWVFNVADAAITVGAVCLAVSILFFGGSEILRDKEKPAEDEE